MNKDESDECNGWRGDTFVENAFVVTAKKMIVWNDTNDTLTQTVSY